MSSENESKKPAVIPPPQQAPLGGQHIEDDPRPNPRHDSTEKSIPLRQDPPKTPAPRTPIKKG